MLISLYNRTDSHVVGLHRSPLNSDMHNLSTTYGDRLSFIPINLEDQTSIDFAAGDIHLIIFAYDLYHVFVSRYDL
jgi:hypothetical protein